MKNLFIIFFVIQVASCSKNKEPIKYITDNACIVEDSCTTSENGYFNFKFNRITNRILNGNIKNVNSYDNYFNGMYIYFNINSNFSEKFKIVEKESYEDLLENEIKIDIYGSSNSNAKYIASAIIGFVYFKSNNEFKFCNSVLEYYDDKNIETKISGKVKY